MTRLLRTELTRLRWRRAVLLLTLAAFVIPGLILAAGVWETRPVSGAEQERIEQLVAEEREAPYVQRQLKRCLERPLEYGIRSEENLRAECEANVLPQVEWYAERQVLDLREQATEGGAGAGVVVVLAVLMLLIGTTFVGHDWNTRSMSNQLLFEARRGRVWTAKALAVTGYCLVLSAVVLFAWWAALHAVASSRDLPIPDGTAGVIYGQAVRGALLATVAGLGGYVVTMLFRSTVVTLGLLFATAVAVPVVLTNLTFDGHIELQPQYNGLAVIADGVTIDDYDREQCWEDPAGVPGCQVHISAADGTRYFAVLLLLTGAPSLLLYRRRDVP